MASLFSGPINLSQVTFSVEHDLEEEDFSDTEIQDEKKKVQDILTRVKQIPVLEPLLQEHYPVLFLFFQKYCSSAVLLVAKKCPQEVVNFFQQVSIYILLRSFINILIAQQYRFCYSSCKQVQFITAPRFYYISIFFNT